MSYADFDSDADERPEDLALEFIRAASRVLAPESRERDRFEKRVENRGYDEAMSGSAGDQLMRESQRNDAVAAIHEGCKDVLIDETSDVVEEANDLYDHIRGKIKSLSHKMADEGNLSKRRGMREAMQDLRNLKVKWERALDVRGHL